MKTFVISIHKESGLRTCRVVNRNLKSYDAIIRYLDFLPDEVLEDWFHADYCII